MDGLLELISHLAEETGVHLIVEEISKALHHLFENPHELTTISEEDLAKILDHLDVS